MPITAKQIEQRRRVIGASDVPAILGVCPWRSTADVWAEKTGLIEPAPSTWAQELGNRLEPFVLDWARDRLGPIRANQRRVYRGDYKRARGRGRVPLAANLDGVLGNGEPVQVKTVGICWPTHEHWGEDGSDDIPRRVIAQEIAEMLCAGAERAHVVAFLNGGALRHYIIPFHARLADAVLRACDAFWAHVEANLQPPNATLSLDVAKALVRTPDSVVEIDPELYLQWSRLREERLRAQQAEQRAQERLLSALGTAEAGTIDGNAVVTYYEQAGACKIDREKLRRDGVYEAYASATTHRVLRSTRNGKQLGESRDDDRPVNYQE